MDRAVVQLADGENECHLGEHGHDDDDEQEIHWILRLLRTETAVHTFTPTAPRMQKTRADVIGKKWGG